MSSAPFALIMAGGTGGHVYPALAVAKTLLEQGWKVAWVGTDRDLEARVVPQNGIPLHTLATHGLRGKGWAYKLSSIFRLGYSLMQALALMIRLKPNVVLGMGGYVTGPTGIAAFLLRRPLVIHEQNAVAGTANRWLRPFAQRTLCGLPGAFKGADDVLVVGNPVRQEITAAYFNSRMSAGEFTQERPFKVLVLGGSLGSLPLNKGVPEALAQLTPADQQRVVLRHQCGDQHFDVTAAAYSAVGIQAEVSAYIENMAEAYLWADLVIARSGALTVSELLVTATPAILIPLPHAIDDHQTMNAKVLTGRGAALLLPQPELATGGLSQMLTQFLAAPAGLRKMSEAAHAMASPTATDAVVDVLTEVAHAA